MILLSKKDNSTKAEVIKYDDKCLTYQVRFLNGEKKGKTAAIVHNTQNNRVDLEAQSERRSR